MRTVPASGPPVLSQVLVRKATPESTGLETDIDLAPLGAASYVLLDVDAEAREVLLWRDERPLIVGFDGQARPLSFEPGDIQAQSSTYTRVGDGWVAWDASRESGPYQIGWSLGGRSGRHRTNVGRRVTSAAVDPTGSYIAISETTTLSIGNARDVVYVLRSDNGAAVFRRYLIPSIELHVSARLSARAATRIRSAFLFASTPDGRAAASAATGAGEDSGGP